MLPLHDRSVCRTLLCLPVLPKAGSERLKATGERDVARLFDEGQPPTREPEKSCHSKNNLSQKACRPSQAPVFCVRRACRRAMLARRRRHREAEVRGFWRGRGLSGASCLGSHKLSEQLRLTPHRISYRMNIYCHLLTLYL